MRKILGLILGVAAGMLVQALVVYLASLLFEVPVIRSAAHEEIAEAFASSSTPALLASILSYFAAGVAAAAVGIGIGRSAWVGWTAGGVIVLIALLIALMFPEPAWAQFGAFIAALIGTALGRRSVAERPDGVGESGTAAASDA